MKPFFILALSLGFALVQVAGAEDQPKKKKAAAAKTASAHATAAAARAPATVHRNVQTQRNLSNPSFHQSVNANVQNSHIEKNNRAANTNTQINTQQRFNRQKTEVVAERNNRVSTASRQTLRNGVNFAEAVRLHRREFHNRDWWRYNHTRIILIGGGYYFWDAGYWYPAWGYDRYYSNYVYDGPIYAYNDLPPDQVIFNVQGALQQQGYYRGAVDGALGPRTRAALANYQRDHGLEITSAVDEPTLASLGLV
jgi:hypothetical protein